MGLSAAQTLQNNLLDFLSQEAPNYLAVIPQRTRVTQTPIGRGQVTLTIGAVTDPTTRTIGQDVVLAAFDTQYSNVDSTDPRVSTGPPAREVTLKWHTTVPPDNQLGQRVHVTFNIELDP